VARHNDADICPLNHNKIKGTQYCVPKNSNITYLRGLCLSIACVRHRESQSAMNIASLIISTFLVLIMAGIVVLAVFLDFLNKGIDFGYFDSIILYLYEIFKLSFYS
jgi:hypothetical protein